MKCLMLLFVCLIAGLGVLEADVYHSTLAGGWWFDSATWQSSSFPDADDEVHINGIVWIDGDASCNDLYIHGSDAVLRAHNSLDGSITVYGDLTTSGWVSNSVSHYLTVNLYGNLSIGYHFVPQTFNWLGAGDKTIDCYDDPNFGIKARYTNIAAEVGTIYAVTDLYFLPGHSSTPQIQGLTEQATISLFDPLTRTTHNLYSRSCHLENIKILGDGSSVFNFNNDSNLTGVHMKDCLLENLVTTGIHNFDSGCSIKNITNNGNINNFGSGSRTTTQYGSLVNNGQIASAYGYYLTLHSYGDIINNGLFNLYALYLKGSDARTLQSTETYPIKASGAIYGEAGLGDIYAGEQLYFANVPNISGPISFKAFTQARTQLPKTICFSSVNVNNCDITGIAGSAIHGTELKLYNTPVSDLAIHGTISFGGTSTLTNGANYGTVQNSSSESSTLSIYGNFSNYGTMRSFYGRYFTINAYDDVLNYGSWENYTLNLYGDDAQNICFGAGHPFAGIYLYDITPASALYVVEDDLYIQANTMDLNYGTLYLTPGGYDLHLNGTLLVEAYIASDLGNNLNMSNTSRVNNVGFQSITNTGTLLMNTNIGFSGDLVNQGTLNNYGASINLTVAGSLSNHGTIENFGGYYLSVNVGGNLINNGIWNNYHTRANGSADQLIHFPPDHPYTGNNFTDTNADSHLYTDADLGFVNCNIDMNYAQLRLQSGRVAYNLNLSACNVYEAVFISSTGSTLTAINGGAISLCSFQSITLAGTLSLNSNIIISGDLVNNGILQNSGNSINLTVGGSISNNGTIQNGGGFTLTVNVAGNAINNGNWNNLTLRFNGAAPQQIHFPSTHPFTGSNLYDNNPDSALLPDCDTYFAGTYIDMDYSQLVLSGGYDLVLNNCTLQEAIVLSDASSVLNMNGGGVGNTSFQSITMSGTVSLQSHTYVSGDLVNLGTLRNSGNSYHIYISGNLDNQGEIISYSSYNLWTHCAQNVINSGSIGCYQLDFNGANPQYFSNTGTISVTSLIDSNAASSLVLLTNLSLTNTQIDLNNANLVLNQGGRDGRTLTLNGGWLSETGVTGGNGARLIMSNGAYLSAVGFDDIIWEGTILLNGNTAVNNLSNYATVKNTSNTSATLTVYQRFDNHAGALLASNNYTLYLSVQGDVYNYGQIQNFDINFTGSGNQFFYHDPAADLIRCQQFRKTQSSGDVTLLSDLRLANCVLNLYDRSLYMQSGDIDHSLYMGGGYVSNTVMVAPGNSILNLNDGCYLSAISGGNHTLQGDFTMAGNCFFGNLINNAVLKNRSSGNASVYLSGSFTNNGSSFNNTSYYLYFHVSGNMVNNGTLANRRVYMTGTQNQLVQLNGTETLEYLVLNSDVGSATWYRNSVFAGSGTSISLAMNDPNIEGVWQAYNSALETWGRTITISIVPPSTLDAPANLRIILQTEGVKLIWNQVAGADSYTIYASDNPAVGFEALMSDITDPNPGDGIVEQVLEAGQPKRFFQVRAYN